MNCLQLCIELKFISLKLSLMKNVFIVNIFTTFFLKSLDVSGFRHFRLKTALISVGIHLILIALKDISLILEDPPHDPHQMI